MNNNEPSNSLQRLQESSLIPIVKDKQGYSRPATLGEAVKKNQGTMLDIQKNGGLRNLVGWVKGRLIELLQYLGAFDIAGEYQIQMLATRICTKFYYWTVPELDYAFLAFANGEYGKLNHYNHDRDTSVINPQDIMKSLIEYEKDMLEARGKLEEEKTKAALEAQKRKEALLPHGLEAWKIYCEKNGLDPSTHKLQSVSLDKHDVNKILKR